MYQASFWMPGIQISKYLIIATNYSLVSNHKSVLFLTFLLPDSKCVVLKAENTLFTDSLELERVSFVPWLLTNYCKCTLSKEKDMTFYVENVNISVYIIKNLIDSPGFCLVGSMLKEVS